MPTRDDTSPAVLSAQDLRSGQVVYWCGDGWSATIGDAAIAWSPAAAQEFDTRAVAANAGNDVIDAFVLPIIDDAGGRRPAHLREARRAAGPSIAVGPR